MDYSSTSVKNAAVDPEYIKFLLNPELEYDYYFVVGNVEYAPVEKIGVIGKMLAAHSEVFRSQLLDKKWKSKEPVHIKDIFPATFKNLLRFVYGFDTTADMSFDDADDLLYVADRYIMPRLKNKLATRLMSLLDYSNICSLLNNPACSKALEFQSEIDKVIQLQTDRILAHPQFLSCSLETFLRILEQEALNIPEIDLWQAALKWVTNKVKSDDSESLRHLVEPLRHIRVGAILLENYSLEVPPVTKEEEVEITETRVPGKTLSLATAFCPKTNPRKKTYSGSKFHSVWYKKSEQMCIDTRGIAWAGVCSQNRSFMLQTLEFPVKIVTLACFVYLHGEYNFTTTIQEVGSAEPVVAHSSHNTLGQAVLHLDVSTYEREVVLSADTKYAITISCDRVYYGFSQRHRVVIEEHFVLEYLRDLHWGGRRNSPVAYINYKTLAPLADDGTFTGAIGYTVQ